MEAAVRGIYNCHLWKNFLHREVGDMESEWAMFKSFTVEAAG